MSESTVDLAAQLERAVGRQDALRERLRDKLQEQEDRIDIRLRALGVLALLDGAVKAGDIVVASSPHVVESEPGSPEFTDTNFRLRNDVRRSGVVRRYVDVGRIGIKYWETNFPNLDLKATNIDATQDGKIPVTTREPRRRAPRVNLDITFDAIDQLASSIESLSPILQSSRQNDSSAE